MTILLVRHGIAEDREAFAKRGEEDDLRPLTKEGRRKIRKAAKGLSVLISEVAVVATSPLKRAVQTGQTIAKELGAAEPVQIAPLSPRKSAQALLSWLQAQPADATLLLVGHEPSLGIFASWLLTGLQESFVVFKKGGICAIELGPEAKPGRGKLLWALRPSQLRQLGKLS